MGKQNALSARDIDKGKTYRCIEGFVAELGDGSEFAMRRGQTIRGSHPAVKRCAPYFVEADTPENEWPTPGWDHVIASDIEADQRLRHERDAKHPPQRSADESYEVTTAFATAGRAFNVGDRIRRDDPVVAGNESYLVIPARPLVL